MSSYFESLDDVDKTRYLAKLNELCLGLEEDPFAEKKQNGFTDSTDGWPLLEFGKIYAYLIDSPGICSQHTMSAHKSLEADKFVRDGFVQTVWHRQTLSKNHIMKAKVMRSQATTQSPHEAWIGMTEDGTILSAHCTCMAGLGEVCSHAAAVMFKVFHIVKSAVEQVAPTSLPRTWNTSFNKKIEPALVKRISFQRGKRKKPIISTGPIDIKFDDPTELLIKMRRVEPKAAIFTLTNPTPPGPITESLPPSFEGFYSVDYEAALIVAEKTLTEDQVTTLERKTRLQSKSRLWMNYRRGRVTASYFGDVMSTSLEKPAKSLLHRICQLTSPNPSIKGLKWGRENEPKAVEEYSRWFISTHKGAKISTSGLVLYRTHSFLGATPDRILECTCHGKGILEVKCPSACKDQHPCSIHEKYMSEHISPAGPPCKNYLPPKHKYYWQIQGQLAICQANFAHFLLWTPQGIHIEEILPNRALFEKKMIPKLSAYFKKIVLPEISKQPPVLSVSISPVPSTSTRPDGYYCSCGKPDCHDNMIGCDSPDCPIQWYHMKCVNLSSAPEGDWFCSLCQHND